MMCLLRVVRVVACGAGLPIAVGGNSMLTTASYEARKFGVRSAMPGFIAKQLCPELIIVPVHFDKYRYSTSILVGES